MSKGILENCTDLWYLLSDFFYKHKCSNGCIDPTDDDFYSFKKRDCIYGVRRYSDNNFTIKRRNFNTGKELIIKNIASLQEVENKLEELINEKRNSNRT